MYTEEHNWSKGLSRAVSRATRGADSLLKSSWRVLTFQPYRDCRKLVETAVRVYGHKIRTLDTEDDIKKRVNYIVNRIADSESAICWGVDCTHVARYMDRSFEQYTAEASSSYKLLWRLAYAVKHLSPVLINEALNETLEYIESHEEAYDDRQAPPRPSDAPRDPISCFGEARGML